MARPVHNPPNRFGLPHVEWDEAPPRARLEIVDDASRSILVRNDSPDVPFTWSVNPYRGCTHACAYCYARPFHEYLGLGAGTDFESRIFVKRDAADLLEAAFRRPAWLGERVAFSGVTDCYQPLERRFGITRACLSVCADFRNPVGVVTRSPLVARDLDLLADLHREAEVTVTFSLPILDRDDCAALEPGAPSPRRRLDAMEALAAAGIPVGVNLAPMIPGITDRAIPATLSAARAAGARWAHVMDLRLPGAVARVFEERLRAALPDRAEGILARQRRARGGRLNDPRFGSRNHGRGPEAEAAHALFLLWRDRLGFEGFPEAGPPTFRRPPPAGQLPLFPGTPRPGRRAPSPKSEDETPSPDFGPEGGPKLQDEAPSPDLGP